MPTAINSLDKVYIDDLLVKIRIQSGLNMHESIQYKTLEKKIKDIDKCSPWVSISTLKRLFQIKMPTESTLDILAKYVGYQDWAYFKSDIRGKDEYYLQHVLSIIQLKNRNNIDLKLINHICERFSYRKENITFLTNLVRIASERNDFDFFKEIFNLPNVFDDNEKRFYDYYYLGQAICIAMRKNPQLAKAVQLIYCYDKNAIERCINNFVDEDYLEGYYGDWIDEYMKSKPDDKSKAFCYCMKYTQGFKKADEKETTKWYKKLLAINFNDASKTILLGRVLAIKLIEEAARKSSDQTIVFSEVEKVIFDAHRRKDKEGFYLGFQLYMLRYLYMAKQNELILKIVKLFDKLFVDLLNEKPFEHWNKKLFYALQIYRAYAYMLDNNSEKAKATFDLIDSIYFEPFIYQSLMNDYLYVKNLIDLETTKN